MTQQLVAALDGSGEGHLGREFGTNHNGFYALLASENGKGVGWMLSSYPGIFGRRLMCKVRIIKRTKSEMPDLCWILEPVQAEAPSVPQNEAPPNPDRPMSRKERRHQKRQSRSTI